MWADNETDRDFLDFSGVADAVGEIIVQASGRPKLSSVTTAPRDLDKQEKGGLMGEGIGMFLVAAAILGTVLVAIGRAVGAIFWGLVAGAIGVPIVGAGLLVGAISSGAECPDDQLSFGAAFVRPLCVVGTQVAQLSGISRDQRNGIIIVGCILAVLAFTFPAVTRANEHLAMLENGEIARRLTGLERDTTAVATWVTSTQERDLKLQAQIAEMTSQIKALNEEFGRRG